MARLLNGCVAINRGRIVEQPYTTLLPPQLEVVVQTIRGIRDVVLASYIPTNEGKCRKIAYVTSSNEEIRVLYFNDIDALQPYHSKTYTIANLSKRHKVRGTALLNVYKNLRRDLGI